MLRFLLYPPFLLFDFVFTTFLACAIFLVNKLLSHPSSGIWFLSPLPSWKFQNGNVLWAHDGLRWSFTYSNIEPTPTKPESTKLNFLRHFCFQGKQFFKVQFSFSAEDSGYNQGMCSNAPVKRLLLLLPPTYGQFCLDAGIPTFPW